MDEEKEQLEQTEQTETEEIPEAEGGDSEVGDFLDDFFTSEESQPDSKPEERKQEEVEETTEESVDESDQPVDEQEPAQEPEPELDELTQLKSQNQALLEHIEKLSGQVVGGKIAAPAPPQTQQQDAQQPQESTPQQSAQLPNFLEGVSVDDLLEDPEKLNSVLGRVYQAAQEQSVNLATQQALRSVPELVVGYITRHTAMNRMVDDFYKEHPDLVNVKQTVAAVANTVHSENSDWSVDKVFSETAKRTRKLLGLKKQAEQVALRSQAKKPAFAKQRGARKEEPSISGLQKEINDLLIDT
jgi:hypothetical protein